VQKPIALSKPSIKRKSAWRHLVTANPLFFTHLGQIANLANMHRLAAIHSQRNSSKPAA
jgi:hypothetical protein